MNTPIKLNVGDTAPAFSLPDQTGTAHSLADYQGKWVLVYFYPKDDTPGCTVEACSIRDNLPRFEGLKAVVLGISKDTVESHAKFAKKHKLPFTILADPEHAVISAYGAWGPKKFMGRTYDGTIRSSFLVDPAGKIARVYPKVKPTEHTAQVLADIEELSKKT